jgi:hypothetical protein
VCHRLACWVERGVRGLWREVYEYVDAHPYVICDARWYAKGQQSQMPVDVRQTDVYDVRNGKIVRITLGYANMAEALDAAGMRE